MNIHLQREIDNLKKKLLLLSSEVENSLSRAIQALKDVNYEAARDIYEYDETIDKMEVQIEEECLKILALHQPVAIDLRIVVSIIKINNDLERIADNVANLAKRIMHLGADSKFKVPERIFKCVAISQEMLKNAIDSFINLDAQLARHVIDADDTIDAMHRQMFHYVEENLPKEPDAVSSLIAHLTISRQIERISDLVTNIAENVIYVIQGEIVRHGN